MTSKMAVYITRFRSKSTRHILHSTAAMPSVVWQATGKTAEKIPLQQPPNVSLKSFDKPQANQEMVVKTTACVCTA